MQSDVPHAIQLALAPIFLLTGVAGMLNVMASRLGRIVDRSRRLTEMPGHVGLSPDELSLELRGLARRRRFANSAITACTIAALLVCVVIALLFFEALSGIPLRWFQGILFAGSTIALVWGLAMFLREIHVATRSARFTNSVARTGVARNAESGAPRE
jgi:hypothetical protein